MKKPARTGAPGAKRTITPRFLSLAAMAAVACCGAPAHAAADRAHVVNIFAWSDYFPQTVIDRFQAATGMRVNLTVLDSPDMAETALSVGNSNYDIVTMNAAPQLGREIPKGFWKQLDAAKTPNVRNADPRILQILQQVDPGNRYAVPWMWGTVGIMYNADKIKSIMAAAPVDSLDMILKKDVAAKFEKCGISILDSWGHSAHGGALHRSAAIIGRSGQAQCGAGEACGDQAADPSIASSGYYEQLADGELCLSSAIPAMP